MTIADEASAPTAYLAAMLRTPINVAEITRGVFKPGSTVRDEVVMSNRCILVLRGALKYEVERVSTTLEAGVQLLVPNWVRRTWRTREGCEILWVDFATPSIDACPLTLFWRRPESWALERKSMERMLGAWNALGADNPPHATSRLQLEGELKALLGRFWPGAQAAHPTPFAQTHFAESLHPEIRRAAEWLSERFAQPDAVASFYDTLLLSPDYFRRQFQEAYGENMQTRLNRIRLRRARFLVHETSLTLKEIAAQCGFADPLFFSRQYRKFWGAAPSADRTHSRA